MGSYVVRRAVEAVPLLLGVSVLSFLLVHAIPGGPLGAYAGEQAMSPEDVARIRHQLGLDEPLHIQYLSWLWRYVQGDWGTTLLSRQSVRDVIARALPGTALLLGVSISLALVLGVVAGTVAAVRQYSALDMLISGISFVGLSMPVFWLGLLVILTFSVTLAWLPAGGMETTGAPLSVGDRLQHLILPVLVSAFGIFGQYARFVRSSVLDVSNMDYVRTAHAKGLPPWAVLVRHVLRTSLVPLVTVFATQLPWMIAGFVVTESIFSWPGMGRLLWTAAVQRDYPMLLAIMQLVATAVILANLLADVVYTRLDPRIAYEHRL